METEIGEHFVKVMSSKSIYNIIKSVYYDYSIVR